MRRLSEEGLLDPTAAGEIEASSAALVRFLFRMPSCMVGVSLDDLAGEVEPVNIPGVGVDQHPSWSRKMSKSLDAIDLRLSIDD